MPAPIQLYIFLTKFSILFLNSYLRTLEAISRSLPKAEALFERLS